MKHGFMLISQQKLTPQISDLLYAFFKRKNRGEEDFLVSKYIPCNNISWVGSGREALRQILLNITSRKFRNIHFDNSNNPNSSNSLNKPNSLDNTNSPNSFNSPVNNNLDIHLSNNSLKKLRVGMPAYTCKVVLDTLQRAGCEPIFYDSGIIADVDDISKIIRKIDVLIVCYNFGFMPEMEEIADLCTRNRIILIEDCAQALGATSHKKLAGSFGDYAFYSFGISKNIGFCGGLIGSKEKIDLLPLKPFPAMKLMKILFEVLISPLFFNRFVYSYTRTFLGKELSKEQEQLHFSVSPFAKKVVLNQMTRYDRIIELRRKNAKSLLIELRGSSLLTYDSKDLAFHQGNEPAWLYFPVFDNGLISHVENKLTLQEKLLQQGVEIGKMETFRCFDKSCLKAKETEQTIFTFAPYRSISEIKMTASVLKKILPSPPIEKIKNTIVKTNSGE